MKLKALSIKQPWAGFILVSGKPVENRSWSSDYVGPLLIHAGKTFDHRVPEEIDEQAGVYKMEVENMDEFKRGCLVGIAWKDVCVRGDDNPPTIWHDPGMVWWPLRHAAPLAELIPCRGELSLFEIEICPETRLKKRVACQPATIGEWLEMYGSVAMLPKNPKDDPPDIHLITKSILADVARLNPSWGKKEFLEACHEAFRIAEEKKKSGRSP